MTATAITIGNFDGVHLGHRALIDRCRERVGASGRVVAMAFDPHPNSVVNPARAPARLTIFARRESLLRDCGAEEVVRLEPTRELLSLSPREFVEKIVATHSPAWVVEGDDFHFGRGRTGNVSTLQELAPAFGFGVDVVEARTLALTDHLVVKASSTLLRWLLEHGRAADASLVLGRPYELEGEVRSGDRRGRTIGFPTANLAPENTPPADGVYAARATLPDGSVHPCMLNVGTRPTFRGVDRRVEVHVIDAPRDGERLHGVPEYGWRLRIELLAWMRDQVKFGSLNDLISQLARDRERALWYSQRPHSSPLLNFSRSTAFA